MKRNDAPSVRCEYAGDGKRLSLLLEESFRLWLARRLAGSGSPTGSRRQ